MFSTPTFRVYNQENKDIIARKPDVSNSARKPLADRAVNQKFALSANKPANKILPKPELTKPKTVKKSTPTTDYPDYYSCSFKEVEDTYEDIWPQSQRLNKLDFINYIKTPPTPPFKRGLEIDSMLFELPEPNTFKFLDEDNILEKKSVDDIGMPDFDLLTDSL